MPFTLEERAKIRTHLGYLNVGVVGSLTAGLPRPVSTLFMVEISMSNVLPEGEDRVRRLLTTLDGIECRMVDAQDRLAAISLGELKLREDEIEKLEYNYYIWASRLADELAAPLYPYAERFKKFMGGGSIPVMS